MKKRIIIIISALIVAAVIGGYFLLSKGKSSRSLADQTTASNVNGSEVASASAPKPVQKEGFVTKLVNKVKEEAVQINDTYISKPNVLWPVAFTSQAPFANWDALHEEACEEASMIMAYHYYNQLALSPTIAEKEIQEQVAWQSDHGYTADLDAEQVQAVLKRYYSLESKLISNPVAADIEKELADGNLIIVPAAGRQLGNPNFTYPGPLYHMLILIGYDSKQQEFITNDPGTRKGAGYRYDYKVLLSANHDYNGGDVVNGEHVVVVVKKPVN